MADGIKMIAKEDFIPEGAHRVLHTLAPAAALFPALVVFAVIPFGDVLVIGGKAIPLQVANLNVGILYIFSIASLAVYGTMLAGWASNNNYSLLGGLRASSQMISYEVSMGLSVLGILMIYQSAQLDVIVREQGQLLLGFIPKWGVLLQPVAFFLFLAAAVAENKRAPFDLPEGESEIIGYFVEYSSMKFGMFFLAEFVEIVIVAGLVTTLFFGGWQFPYLQADGFHWPFEAGVWHLPHLLVVADPGWHFLRQSAGVVLDLAARALDPPPLSVRSGHAPGMEDDVAARPGQPVGHSRDCPPGDVDTRGTRYGNVPVLDLCHRRCGVWHHGGVSSQPHEQRHLSGGDHAVPGGLLCPPGGTVCGGHSGARLCRGRDGPDIVCHYDAQLARRDPGARRRA